MFLQDLGIFPTDDARLAGDAGLDDRRLLSPGPSRFPVASAAKVQDEAWSEITAA